MTLLLCDAEREPAVARRIASSLFAEAHQSRRARLMLPWELGRLAELISEFWNGRISAARRWPSMPGSYLCRERQPTTRGSVTTALVVVTIQARARVPLSMQSSSGHLSRPDRNVASIGSLRPVSGRGRRGEGGVRRSPAGRFIRASVSTLPCRRPSGSGPARPATIQRRRAVDHGQVSH